MTPIVDANLHVRAGSDGNLDDSISCVVSYEIWGTGGKGLALSVYVPSAMTGCNPVLTVSVYASTTSTAATTDTLIASRAITEAMGGAEYIIPFFTNKRSVAFGFEVSGGSTPVFSHVDAWLVENHGLDWKRTSEFA